MAPSALEQALTIFVTGGTGFVGQHLLRSLRAAGHAVRALVRGAPGKLPAGVEPVTGDLAHVERFAAGLVGCDVVIHAAALCDPVPDDAQADLINRRATIELADAAELAGARGFVFISSIAAIGIRHMPGGVHPATACVPTSVYGQTKRAAERALLERGPGLRAVVIRPPTVYGEGERRNFLALTRAIDSGLFVVPGAGNNRISFCHVSNLVDALLLAATSDRIAGTYHVADEPAPTLRELAETIARALGRRLLPLPLPLPLAWVAAVGCEVAAAALSFAPPLSRARLRTLTGDYVLDCTTTKQCGYRPRVGLEVGVRQTVAWYRRERLIG